MSANAPMKVSGAWNAVLLVCALLVPGVLIMSGIMGVSNEGPGDFPHFYNAGVAVERGDSLYLRLEEQTAEPYAARGGGYIYPPMLALVFRPLAKLGYDLAKDVWIVSNMILLGICVFVLAWKAVGVVVPKVSGCARILMPLATSGIALGVLYDTVIAQAKLAQTDVLLIACLTLALVSYKRFPLVCGLILAGPIMVKYTTLVFVPYLIVRAQWRVLIGIVVGIVIGALGPALVFGWSNNLSELRISFSGLMEMLGVQTEGRAAGIYPITWERSVTVPSFWARVAEHFNLSGLFWIGLTLVTALWCFGASWWLFVKNKTPLILRLDRARGVISGSAMRLVTLDWAMLVLASMIFSPQSTKRHLIVYLIPMVLAGALCVVPMKAQRVTRLPLILAMLAVFLASVLPPANAEQAIWAWRRASGLGWVSIVFTLVLIWTTLRVINEELKPNDPQPDQHTGQQSDPEPVRSPEPA